jgi:hypothetical protein
MRSPNWTRTIAAAVALVVAGATTTTTAHYANMGMDGISCYIYNGIKGTPAGHMIVRDSSNNTWFDNDDRSNRGNVTVVRSQGDYDALEVKTKIGIVCVPDEIDIAGIGIPYVEMEPSDEEFYGGRETVYESSRVGVGGNTRDGLVCIIRFCRGDVTES